MDGLKHNNYIHNEIIICKSLQGDAKIYSAQNANSKQLCPKADQKNHYIQIYMSTWTFGRYCQMGVRQQI